MLLSPVRLERYYFEELAFRHDADFDAETNDVSTPLPVEALQAALDFGHQESDERRRFYRLKLELPESAGRFCCSFRAVAIGFFTVDESCASEKIAAVANAHAPAVLYGVAREAVAALSGRGPLPPVCLPAVHFLDFAHAMDEEGKKQSGAQTGKTKSAAAPKAVTKPKAASKARVAAKRAKTAR